MAAIHLAYPDLALDKFCGTDSDQDIESFLQLLKGNMRFNVGDTPANPDALANYIFHKKLSFLLYPEAVLRNGMEITLRLQPHGTISERTLSLDFLMNETNFAIDWKLNTLLEVNEKKFGIFFTELNEQFTSVGLTT